MQSNEAILTNIRTRFDDPYGIDAKYNKYVLNKTQTRNRKMENED